VYVDKELGGEGFAYELQSGKTGTVHVEQVLEYNRDPNYLRDLMLYKLTLEAQRRIAASPLSKREIIRRLGTSATQLYRLLDQTNYKKSLDQLVSLLQLLDATLIWWYGRSPRDLRQASLYQPPSIHSESRATFASISTTRTN
jgi:hypothetical protein